MNIHEYKMTEQYREEQLRYAEKMRLASQLQEANPSPNLLERLRRNRRK